MDGELSMGARVEITKKYATAYRRASKKDKGQILHQVCSVTGWSRDNARRRLIDAGRAGTTVSKMDRRKRRPAKYSLQARNVLTRVWAVSGGQCGKYLAVSLPALLDSLENHDELVHGSHDYSPGVRSELEAMSAATIDRYLAPARATDQLRGISTTKAGALLRSSITIRKAGDEVEAEPGFFEGDTVAHCGPTLRGEFARTLNLTCVHTGWGFTASMRNNASVWVLQTMNTAVATIPFAVIGLDFDNGSEFMNHDLIDWAGTRRIYFTRSRPYKKNDQATIESKNNHLVRKYGFYYRYDTAEELALLNRLWPLVNDRMNYFTPTKKPIGWGQDSNGRRRRIYDVPATPLDRLLAAGVLSPAQETELRNRRDRLNPAELARDIHRYQAKLTGLAKDKTDRLRATLPPAIPHPRGIKVS